MGFWAAKMLRSEEEDGGGWSDDYCPGPETDDSARDGDTWRWRVRWVPINISTHTLTVSPSLSWTFVHNWQFWLDLKIHIVYKQTITKWQRT